MKIVPWIMKVSRCMNPYQDHAHPPSDRSHLATLTAITINFIRHVIRIPHILSVNKSLNWVTLIAVTIKLIANIICTWNNHYHAITTTVQNTHAINSPTIAVHCHVWSGLTMNQPLSSEYWNPSCLPGNGGMERVCPVQYGDWLEHWERPQESQVHQITTSWLAFLVNLLSGTWAGHLCTQ